MNELKENLETTEEVMETAIEEIAAESSGNGWKTAGIVGLTLALAGGIYYGIRKFRARKNDADLYDDEFEEVDSDINSSDEEE